MNNTNVIIKPLVTEKSTHVQQTRNAYAFEVHANANKPEIKKAVEKQYNVNVERVNTMNIMGKKKVRYTQAGVLAGRKPNYKKAIVTLASGEVIDFYSNV
jgi:large subunit ribosomal protein L23